MLPQQQFATRASLIHQTKCDRTLKFRPAPPRNMRYDKFVRKILDLSSNSNCATTSSPMANPLLSSSSTGTMKKRQGSSAETEDSDGSSSTRTQLTNLNKSLSISSQSPARLMRVYQRTCGLRVDPTARHPLALYCQSCGSPSSSRSHTVDSTSIELKLFYGQSTCDECSRLLVTDSVATTPRTVNTTTSFDLDTISFDELPSSATDSASRATAPQQQQQMRRSPSYHGHRNDEGH